MEVNQKSNYTIKSQFFRQTFLIIKFKSIKYDVPVTHTLSRLLSAAAEWAFIHFLYIFYIGADFDAGCWVRKRETNKSGEEKNEPKRGRLVDQ